MRPLCSLGVSVLAGALLLSGCALAPTADDDTGVSARAQGDSPAADYVGMGVEYLKRGQPAVALQRLKRAQELDPNYAPTYNVLGLLYEQLGENDQARENFTHAVRLAPKDPYIRNAYGSFLCNQKQYPAADEEFQAALKNPLYPTSWIALTNAGICMRRTGDSAKAEEYFRQALSASPQFGPALYQMAELSYARGDLSSAKDYIARFLQANPPTAEALALGVRVERGLGDKAQAKRYERVLQERFPDSPEIPKLKQP
jgi:type IV pilus assembly protein PilF